MKNDNVSYEHKQDVTTSLQLNDIAQVRLRIPVFLLIVGAISIPFIVEFAELSVVDLVVTLSIGMAIIFVTAIPAVKSLRESIAFDEEHKQAHRDAQDLIMDQTLGNIFVFNNELPIAERLYGKQ